MDEMWQMPPWFGAYSIAYGIIRIVVLAVYLLSGIFLLQLRPSSLNLFYASAAMTILLSIIHTAVVISSLSFIMAAMGIWGLFGVVIDAVLITVVVTSDKTSIHSQRHDSG